MRAAHTLPVWLPMSAAFMLFSSTGRDDAHITNWAAHALARYGEIVNYNGDRIEQSSSLLHVLILAALSVLTRVPLATLGALVSIGFGCLSVWMTMRLARAMAPDLASPCGWLLGTSLGLLYWSFGQLETTLAASATLALVWGYREALASGITARRLVGTAAVTLAYLAVRPEAVFVVAATLIGVIGVLVVRRWSAQGHAGGREEDDIALRRMVTVAVVAIVIAAGLLTWRQLYFGAWFPQPVVAKAGGVSSSTVWSGLIYVLRQGPMGVDGAVWALATLAAVLAIVRTLRDARIDQMALVATLLLGAGLGFVVASGGDWMEAGRFLVPLLPLAVLLVVSELRRFFQRRTVSVLVATMVVAQCLATWRFATESAPGGPPWATRHVNPAVSSDDVSWFDLVQRIRYREVVCSERLIEVVRSVFKQTGKPVTIMSGQMGLMAFRTAHAEFERVRLIDRLGLTSDDFTSCPVTASVARNSAGLDLTYDRFFARRRALREVCGLGDPDIIYDLDTPDGSRERLLEANGYRVVYRQFGKIFNGSRLIPGAAIDGGEFVAVRADLVRAEITPAQYRFGSSAR